MSEAQRGRGAAPLERLKVSVFVVPTDSPESDGTLEWRSTTLVLVEVSAGHAHGLGYTYAHAATARLIDTVLREALEGVDVMATTAAWDRMLRAVRNQGAPGIAAMAISAVDTALWDLKARLLDLPLSVLLAGAREAVPLYGSGGFTSYSTERLSEQLSGWAEQGLRFVKMKVGRRPEEDPSRARTARSAIGPACELFVDANGAYSRKQALRLAEEFAEQGVTWFEEPVSSDDLEGLRLLRDRAPAGMNIAAGEYGYTLAGFSRLLDAGAVDVLQADVTRCMGVTGFLKVAALAEARCTPLSAHCAPALHLHPACALSGLAHLEYFFDHVRVERLLFDGVQEPQDGLLRPDLSRPGIGLELRKADAERYAV